MPIVQIHMLVGRSVDQKRALVDKVTKAICETADCPPEAVSIIINEMAHQNFSKAGTLHSDKT